MSGLDLLAEIVCVTILCLVAVDATQQKGLNAIGRLGSNAKIFTAQTELQGSSNG